MNNHINEIAVNGHGIRGVIKFYDEEKERYVGHHLNDKGKYWQSTKPEFTGMKLVDISEVPKDEESN